MNLTVVTDDNPIIIQAVIKDSNNNNLVQSGHVIFNVEGENYTVEVVDGKAILIHMFKTFGLANITAYYLDDYAYNPSNSSISKYVPIRNTTLNLTVSNNRNNIEITAVVKDFEGNLIGVGNVTFRFDGKAITINLLNGSTGFNYTFKKEGLYNITAEFNGIYNYNSSKNNSSINISFIKTSLVLDINDNHNPVEIIAYVYDEEDNPVDMGEVTFKIEDKNYRVKVEEGVAKITHIFKNMGINNVSASYAGNYLYNSSNNSEILNVSKIDAELSLSILKNLNNVTVIVASPLPIPVTLPFSSTVATLSLLLVHVTFLFIAFSGFIFTSSVSSLPLRSVMFSLLSEMLSTCINSFISKFLINSYSPIFIFILYVPGNVSFGMLISIYIGLSLMS